MTCAEAIRDLLRDHPEGLTARQIRRRVLSADVTIRNNLRSLRLARLIEYGKTGFPLAKRFRLPNVADFTRARALNPAHSAPTQE